MDLFVLFYLLGHQSLYNTVRYLETAIAFRGGEYAKFHPLMAGQLAPPAWSTRDFPQHSELSDPQEARIVLLARAVPTFEEVTQMLQAALSVRDMLLIRGMYATSIRVAELLKVRPGDLEDSECKLFVRDGKDGQDRYTLIDPQTAQWWRQLPSNGGPTLFGLKDVSAVERIVDKIAGRLGLQAKYQALGQKLSPHSFRHAFATHCYAAGMSPANVRVLLGHDSLKTTQLYVQCPFSHYRAVYDRCQP